MNRLNLQKKVLTVMGPHGAHRQTYYIRPGEEAALHSRGGAMVEHRIATTTAKSRVEMHYGLLWAGHANKGVDHALEQIDKVHAVPSNLYRLPVKVTGTLGGANGLYRVWNAGSRNEINVSKYAFGPSSTMAHEYGHFLDHHLFGDGKKQTWDGLGTFARLRTPETAGTSSSARLANKDLQPLMRSIFRSKATGELIAKAEQQRAAGLTTHASDYLLMPPELFARAYAQWITTKSGSRQMKTELDAFSIGWRGHGYSAQWEDKDFAPISREFDRLFQRRGLLREGH